MVALPEEILVKHKVSQEDILRSKMNVNIKDVFFEIASEAHLHLESVSAEYLLFSSKVLKH